MTSVPISVLIPVKNAASHIDAALQSISDQTFSDFEAIVVDDNSDDGTSEKLSEWAINDPRFVIIRGKGNGIVRALNLGLSFCRGELIARMDADDISRPERLALQRALLLSNQDLVLVAGGVSPFGNSNKRYDPICPSPDSTTLLNSISLSPTIFHPAVMYRRSSILSINGYRRYFEGAEDHDLYLRMAAYGKFSAVEQVILDYRLHDKQVSQRKRFQGQLASAVAVYCWRQRLAGHQDPVDAKTPAPRIGRLGYRFFIELIAPNVSSQSDLKIAIRCARSLISLNIRASFIRNILRRHSFIELFKGNIKIAYKLLHASLFPLN